MLFGRFSEDEVSRYRELLSRLLAGRDGVTFDGSEDVFLGVVLVEDFRTQNPFVSGSARRFRDWLNRQSCFSGLGVAVFAHDKRGVYYVYVLSSALSSQYRRAMRRAVLRPVLSGIGVIAYCVLYFLGFPVMVPYLLSLFDLGAGADAVKTLCYMFGFLLVFAFWCAFVYSLVFEKWGSRVAVDEALHTHLLSGGVSVASEHNS